MAEEFKDGLEHLPLPERVALRAEALADLAAKVTGVDTGRSEAERRAANLEARVGELNQTIGDLRAEARRLDAQIAAGPTPWAYEQACKALETHRARADEAEASRQAWAEEAMRLDQMLDEFRQLHHTAYVDEEHQGGNCVDLVLSLLSSRLRASGSRHSLDEVAAEFGEHADEEPSRPQCAVHPEGSGRRGADCVRSHGRFPCEDCGAMPGHCFPSCPDPTDACPVVSVYPEGGTA